MTKLTKDENNTKRPKYYEMTLVRNDWKTFCLLIYMSFSGENGSCEGTC